MRCKMNIDDTKNDSKSKIYISRRFRRLCYIGLGGHDESVECGKRRRDNLGTLAEGATKTLTSVDQVSNKS